MSTTCTRPTRSATQRTPLTSLRSTAAATAFGVLLVAAFLAFGVTGAAGAFSRPAPESAPVVAASDSADRLFELTNERRAAMGAAPLVRDADLDALAADWAREMAASSTLSHRDELGAATATFVGAAGWSVAAENVGRGPTISEIADAFVASDDHRLNVEDPLLSHVGVAVVALDGELWVAVNFTG